MVCHEYKPPKNLEDVSDEATLTAYKIKKQFFEANTVSEICRRYITNIIVSNKDFCFN